MATNSQLLSWRGKNTSLFISLLLPLSPSPTKIITIVIIDSQLGKIIVAAGSEEDAAVGALTTDDRDSWAKVILIVINHLILSINLCFF